MLLRQHSWSTTTHDSESSPPSLSPLNLFSLLPKEDANSENRRSSVPHHVPNHVRKEKIPKKRVILEVLKKLQDAKLTVIDILLHVIEGKGAFDGYYNVFFSPSNLTALLSLLNAISDNEKGSVAIHSVFVPTSTIKVTCPPSLAQYPAFITTRYSTEDQ